MIIAHAADGWREKLLISHRTKKPAINNSKNTPGYPKFRYPSVETENPIPEASTPAYVYVTHVAGELPYDGAPRKPIF